MFLLSIIFPLKKSNYKKLKAKQKLMSFCCFLSIDKIRNICNIKSSYFYSIKKDYSN